MQNTMGGDGGGWGGGTGNREGTEVAAVQHMCENTARKPCVGGKWESCLEVLEDPGLILQTKGGIACRILS